MAAGSAAAAGGARVAERWAAEPAGAMVARRMARRTTARVESADRAGASPIARSTASAPRPAGRFAWAFANRATSRARSIQIARPSMPPRRLRWFATPNRAGAARQRPVSRVVARTPTARSARAAAAINAARPPPVRPAANPARSTSSVVPTEIAPARPAPSTANARRLACWALVTAAQASATAIQPERPRRAGYESVCRPQVDPVEVPARICQPPPGCRSRASSRYSLRASGLSSSQGSNQ